MSIFSKVRVKKPKYSKFNLGHNVKLTCNFGELIPFMCNEVVPGDVFSNKSELFLRFAPLLAPIMHEVNVYTHFFYVPNRLIWEDWEDFITGGVTGEDAPVHPHFAFGGPDILKGSLGDYLGIPLEMNAQPRERFRINALPFRAYNLIYNEYYRDQTLSKEAYLSLKSGQDTYGGNYNLVQKRAWEKDYFTSALPFPQRGDDVHINAGSTAPVRGNGALRFTRGAVGDKDVILRTPSVGASAELYANGEKLRVHPDNSGLYADLSDAKGATINTLRRATSLQEFLEIAARVGSRYKEQLLGYFGVNSSDARLQRPEYLGGGKSHVVISDVPQTSETTDKSAQATLAGNGVGYQVTNGFKRRFEEHGILIGIMSVLPRTSYSQGVSKLFLKEDRFDYYFPQFANMGEQPILNKELDATSSQPDEVFGYTPRYAEYKYKPSTIHGDFRDTLNFWHLGRQFENPPKLNEEFIKCNYENLQRIFAVEDNAQDKIIVQLYNDTRAIRPMPYYGTPSL